MTAQKNLVSPRPYRMTRRLGSVEETRTRIAAATFELHATIGPARTTISAVAERAGVQRHTVYHHFPDLTKLFRACVDHGIRVTRMPEAGPWLAISDPAARLRTGLTELYAYYRANARLLGNIYRDMPMFADVGGTEQFDERVAGMFSALAGGWSAPDEVRPTLTAAVSHAMSFETWKSLTQGGLTDDQARDMMVGLVTGVAGTTA
jgi:AcrR family transcriptional regulator